MHNEQQPHTRSFGRRYIANATLLVLGDGKQVLHSDAVQLLPDWSPTFWRVSLEKVLGAATWIAGLPRRVPGRPPLVFC